MSDWTLIVESYPGALHNWPRLNGPPRPPRTTPRLMRTTLQNVRATRGHLIVRDFGSSWGLDAPNLEVVAAKGADYRGTLKWTGGTLLIQQYEPMWAHFNAAFRVADGKVVHGAHVTRRRRRAGRRHRRHQSGRVPRTPPTRSTSHHELPRTRAVFYAEDHFQLHGQGDFAGTVRMYKGGYEVKGDFVSPEVGYDAYRFSDVRAAVVWGPTRLDVTRATARLYGGTADFSYVLDPLGQPDRRADARWDVRYRDVDLVTFTSFLQTRGMRMAGRATGRHLTEWTLGPGGFAQAHGQGTLQVAMPPGLVPAVRGLPDDALDGARRRAEEQGPVSPHIAFAPVPLAARVGYDFDGRDGALRAE